MTKTLHNKIEIHPSEPAHTTILKMTANATLEEAAKLDEGKTYSPKFYADGWKIAIETPRGILGLWSCWLGNQFHLGYPGPTVCPVTSTQVGALIEEHLGVKQAEPVLQVDATAVDPHYTGEYKDPNKPLEVNALGQTIAYQTRGGPTMGDVLRATCLQRYAGARADLGRALKFLLNRHRLPFHHGGRVGGALDRLVRTRQRSNRPYVPLHLCQPLRHRGSHRKSCPCPAVSR